MNDATLLRSLITVPYLPLLGPVHPECLDDALVADVFRIGSTDGLLPYDKDRRWYATKPAMILVETIARTPGGMIIPVVTRQKQRVRLLCYGTVAPDALVECVAVINKQIPNYQISVVNFAATATAAVADAATIIFLKRFTTGDVRPADPGVERIAAAEAGDLASLAADADNGGFGFLAREYGARKLGSTFVARDRGEVVAAVGPIDTMTDSAGRRFCLPPYVGVASKFRGRGLGTRVWAAAMAEAAAGGAAYLLLQAEAGQAAASFYERQGLEKLGAVITRPVV